MTQEEKQLLIKDLCGRLPYGVICNLWFKDSEGWKNKDMELTGLFNDTLQMYFTNINGSAYSDEFKPYLRPMSSMTEKEINEYENFIINEKDDQLRFCNELVFYNSHHLDYRGLIPMGLALEAKEGMYKTE